MKNYNIVCICQIFNELRKDNLERFVNYILPLVGDLVVYDDGSTDGSYEYMLSRTPHVIRGTKNDFVNERSHKQLLLEEALKLKPDFILWLDADEVMTANAEEHLQKLCQVCVDGQFDAVKFHEINIWRSHSWRRLDSLFDTGWFCRLWRVVPGICFNETKPGLHQQLFPSTVLTTTLAQDVKVLHYGFSSKQRLAHKYLVYKSHGQRGYDMLDRLISEEKLVLEKVPQGFFPEGLWIDDDEPIPLTFAESLAYVEEYREEVFKPKFTIVCLIYKSVDWLKYVYEQVYKYTDMSDKEFLFVANDANPAVLSYLKDNYISHDVFTNTPQQQEEWFINNVYRAYNFSVSKVQGDFIIFINSDMAFTPGWFEALWQAYDGSNCISSRLVESGKLRSGQFGLERNFGWDYASYQEKEFQQFARHVAEPKIENGGLFMPLLIRKEHFEQVGGYPEGNIVLGSDIDQPVMAREGEACISGDNVLMLKLQARGIKHQTAFDSLIYHFQCGELDSPEAAESEPTKPEVVICNDLVTGSMGEKVLWDFLLESLPASVGIDKYLAGIQGDYAANARNYMQLHYPEAKVILQNATFINSVDASRYTIAFLQDDLRSMGRANEQQEGNLRRANKLVTNSIQTALSYSDYDFEVIPVGVDLELFKPISQAEVRQELGFGTETIGIFVGEFSEVKGWNKVQACIEAHPEITWILVSKNVEIFVSVNATVYNRISQTLLVKLLNCADFFIIGSPVETQCLAAIEACLCDVPLIMRPVGIFKDFSLEERAQCGIFGEDFEGALQELSKRTFSPRQVIIDKKISIQDSMQKWQRLLTGVYQELMIAETTSKKKVKPHKVSIVITTFQRSHLLRWGLHSLSLQTIPFEFETIVVNDGLQDETEEVCNEFKEKLNLKYIFTGQRNLNGNPVWRIPGFAINIGVKQSSGDILVMCCAEMLHVNDTITRLTKPILDNPKLLGIPVGKDDRDGALLESITKNHGNFDEATYNNCVDLYTRMPFLMVLHRSQFIEIGGYDEDLVGIAYDDRDIIDRLLADGCNYCLTDAETAHLYHPRADGYYEGGGPPEWDYNRNLYFSRIGKIVRNEGREWGVMEQDFKPKVSIIIPVFNGSNYMKAAIDSALAQTYTNIEVIVVNDGSNDHGATDNIAVIYGDKIRYFSKENGGVASALNLGIENMNGEYFSWLSHDDIYFPEKIQTQIDILQKSKLKDAILYGGYELIDEHLKVFAQVKPDALHPQEKLNIPLFPILRGLINGCCLLIHKSHFERVGLFDEKLPTTQDYALWFKMFRDAKLIYHKEILVKSRFHPEQSSKKIPNHIPECNQLWISFLDQVTEEEMCEMESSQYSFYKKTAEFLQKNTPYTLAQQHATTLAETVMEKISVIIPFFNRLKLLSDSVNSVLDQTYGNFEVLLIDDGSSEDLTIVKDIIKRDSRVRYVYQDHKGASSARNLGISLAIGSYIAFLDSDDMFTPQKLEKQIIYMQTNGFSFSHTSYQRMDNDGNLLEVINSGSFSGELFPSILAGCSIASPTVMIKKELLENRRFIENMEIGEDICLWIDIASCYPMGGIQEPLSKVRVDSSSASLNDRKQQIGLINIANHIIKNPLYVVHKHYVYLLLTKLLYLFSNNH